MGDNQANEEYFEQLRNRTIEMPLQQALETITDRYLRHAAQVKKMQDAQVLLNARMSGDDAANENTAPARLAEQERAAAKADMDKHFTRNRKEIAQMRDTAQALRDKAEQSKSGVMKKFFNARAKAFETRADDAEEMIDRIVDPDSETRKKATEFRQITARLKQEAEQAKEKFERETDPKEKKKLAREAFKAAVDAARMERSLNQLEDPDRKIGIEIDTRELENRARNQQRDLKQAEITTGNIQRELEDEMPRLRKLETLMEDVFALERHGVETVNVRMLSKRDFNTLAEAVAEAAADLPADTLPSEKDMPVAEQLAVMNRQYDFARKNAPGLLSGFLWQFDELVKKLDGDKEGRALLAEVMPPAKKEQIANDTKRLYARKDGLTRRPGTPKMRV